VTGILTFNGGHFWRFPGVGVMNPEPVSASH
jgi:hypothetical protein